MLILPNPDLLCRWGDMPYTFIFFFNMDKVDKHSCSFPASPSFPHTLWPTSTSIWELLPPVLPQLSAGDCWNTPLEQRGVKWLVEHEPQLCQLIEEELVHFSHPHFLNRSGIWTPWPVLVSSAPGVGFSLFPDFSSSWNLTPVQGQSNMLLYVMSAFFLLMKLFWLQSGSVVSRTIWTLVLDRIKQVHSTFPHQ